MNFEISKNDDVAVFHLKDTRLDLTNSADVKAEFLLISKTPINVLIIDVSSVTFCDSTGLSALLIAERQMREQKGGVIIVDAFGKVKSLIQISKLDEIFPVFNTVDEAKASLEE